MTLELVRDLSPFLVLASGPTPAAMKNSPRHTTVALHKVHTMRSQLTVEQSEVANRIVIPPQDCLLRFDDWLRDTVRSASLHAHRSSTSLL
jgi:hypothetical protein